MKKLLIGLLALTSLTVFADVRIVAPKLESNYIWGGSSATGTCLALGFSLGAVAGSKQTKNPDLYFGDTILCTVNKHGEFFWGLPLFPALMNEIDFVEGRWSRRIEAIVCKE